MYNNIHLVITITKGSKEFCKIVFSMFFLVFDFKESYDYLKYSRTLDLSSQM